MSKTPISRDNIPTIAAGRVVPHIVDRKAMEEERRKQSDRKARLYFWLGIVGTTIGTIVGWLLGKFF